MSATPKTTVRDRVKVFDGVRGIAIILVVLSHAWLVWPHTRGEGQALGQRILLESGNYAVTIFFVVGAFLYTRNLLSRAAAQEGTGLHPGVQVVRRLIRLTPGVAVLMLAAALLAVLEREPTYPDRDLGASARAILTYTWNWFVKDNPFSARADFGHLWYLSVDMQAFLVVLLLVWLLHKRPLWLVAGLAGLLAITLAWKAHVHETEGLYQALLRTNTRIDGPLTGALAACLVPYLQPLARWATWGAVGGVVTMFAVLPLTVDDVAYMTLPGAVLDASLAAIVISCTIAPVSVWLTRTLGAAPLAILGKRSLSVYIWHFPVFMYFGENYGSRWDKATVTAVALAIALLIAFAADVTLERGVSRVLSHPRWALLDRGIPSMLADVSAGRGGEPAAHGRGAVERPVDEIDGVAAEEVRDELEAYADVDPEISPDDAFGARVPAPSGPSRPTPRDDA